MIPIAAAAGEARTDTDARADGRASETVAVADAVGIAMAVDDRTNTGDDHTSGVVVDTVRAAAVVHIRRSGMGRVDVDAVDIRRRMTLHSNTIQTLILLLDPQQQLLTYHVDTAGSQRAVDIRADAAARTLHERSSCLAFCSSVT